LKSVLENRTTKRYEENWKIALQKDMKRIAEEVRRNEQPVTHPDKEETSE